MMTTTNGICGTQNTCPCVYRYPRTSEQSLQRTYRNRRCLRGTNDVEDDGLVSITIEAADFKIGIAALSSLPRVGDRCAAP